MDAMKSTLLILVLAAFTVSGHARRPWNRPHRGPGRESPFHGRQDDRGPFRGREGPLFRPGGEGRFDPARFSGFRLPVGSGVEGGEMGSRWREGRPFSGFFRDVSRHMGDRRDGAEREMPPRPFHDMMGPGRRGEEEGSRRFPPHPHHHRHHAPHPHHHHHHHHHHHGRHNESESSSEERDYNGTSPFPFRDGSFRRPPFWHQRPGKRNCTKDGRGGFSREDRPSRWQWKQDGGGRDHHHHGKRNESEWSSEERDYNNTSPFPSRNGSFRRPPFWHQGPGKRNFTEDGRRDFGLEDRPNWWQWRQDGEGRDHRHHDKRNESEWSSEEKDINGTSIKDAPFRRPPFWRQRPGRRNFTEDGPRDFGGEGRPERWHWRHDGRENMNGGRPPFRRPGPRGPHDNRGEWSFGRWNAEKPEGEGPSRSDSESTTAHPQTDIVKMEDIGNENDIYKVDVNV
ncbi:uncharacterized protein [Diadema setosum]|uniref:uncharacterized protein n=1 Tax=Diadema setosum TaxID=31175 RepID=UPI003B3ACB56